MGLAAYLNTHLRGKLRERVETARSLLEQCSVCPRNCGINRLRGEIGGCGTSRQAMVSSYGPHFDEESPFVGSCGSGAIFFSNCNLGCLFCQNYSTSQLGERKRVTRRGLAYIMLSLQSKGYHSMNLVSPTHVVPQILEALELAVQSGLNIRLVYNSGGYDSVETLRILDGIVDIYVPDMKYDDEGTARELSGIENYPEVNRAAVEEMYRQTGDLEIGQRGVTQRGALVRHLVLPNGLAGTKGIVRFLSQEILRNTYVNIMAQYRPCYKSLRIPGLERRIASTEFSEALSLARQAGLSRLDRAHPADTLPVLSE